MLTTQNNAEVRLVELTNSIRDATFGWAAIHFHFSRLLEHYKNGYQLKIAVNLINDLLRSYQGGVFICQDSSVFVVCRDASIAQLQKVVFQVRYLFADDPLAYLSEGQENPDFCDLYDLSIHWEELNQLAKRLMAKAARGGTAEEVAIPQEAAMPVFGASRLASIERALSHADIQQVLRRQPICALLKDQAARRVFDEVYMNIAHLRQMLQSDVDFLSNRWLFKYLTQLLDQRMLKMFMESGAQFLDSPVSININVSTLLSDAFTAFDRWLKPDAKIAIVFEISVEEIFADPRAFVLARNIVQKLGYRVCLDGLTSLSFTQIDREQLGFDLAKLQWNAEMESDANSPENKRLIEAVKRCGPNRIILCRCDSAQAVEYGQALGMSLFQGRYVDRLINPVSLIEN